MPSLVIPSLDEEPWPTLGGQVCAFIEEYLIFGPGDLRGEKAKLSPEKRAFVYRIYEVYPQGHEQAGRRRFKRVCLSLRKGLAKTELAAWLAAVELHPDGPVRCDGFDASGNPVGRSVTDPYIPMVAYTEEQSDELAYGALKTILEEGPLANDFDIGLERILRKAGDGRAVSLATSPNARDGARTTMQLFDETHRLTLPAQKKAHQTMLANIPKRRTADAWSLEVTTAFAPGERSVAEDTMDYARLIAGGKFKDPDLFYFHRQASDSHDLTSEDGARAAVLEASGADASWSDIGGIMSLWRDPTTDKTYWERVWTNRPVRSADKAFDMERWRACEIERAVPEKGTRITLGFDGARTRDATAIVATEVESGYQWLLGLWERPSTLSPTADWEVPTGEVDAAVGHAMEQWDVVRMYCDPFYWETKLSEWAGRYGATRVVEWRTNRERPMAYSLRAFRNALLRGELTHSGSRDLTRHIGNAVKRVLPYRDESGETEADRQLWLIHKERPDSPHKIDAAMAAVLSWEARNDTLAVGSQEIVWAFGAM